MTKAEEKMVLYSDGNAARFCHGISGWVSIDGRFWGNDSRSEHMARFASATHIACDECGEIHRINAYCQSCHKKKEIERYNAMPRKKWDGEAMLYSIAADTWFNEMAEIKDYCEEYGCDIKSLMLVIGEPTYPLEIDGTDYFYDSLGEDMTLQDTCEELHELIEQVNKYIREKRPIFSWRPGKVAAEIEVQV
jgi:hypothetical protein